MVDESERQKKELKYEASFLHISGVSRVMTYKPERGTELLLFLEAPILFEVNILGD